ncbi:MAG TPA: hypothetical protein VEW07_11340 [Solirubrobacterales bacterium]|nr:hypothetical protein [Solirubrobacterales bacterium]
MEKTWRIMREGPVTPIPGAPRIVRDVALALEPVPGDVLLLDRPDDNLDGEFLVVRRVITDKSATVIVRLFED